MRSGVFIILLLPITVFAASDQPNFGRLFTSPVERERLDLARKNASVSALQAQEKKSALEEAEVEELLPEKVTMQGFVKRSDGKKSTFWLNNSPMQENTSNADIHAGSFNKNKISSENQINLKLNKSGQTFSLKPGQMYLPSEGRVMDLEIRKRER